MYFMSDALFLLDMNGRVVQRNGAGAVLLGFPKESVLGRLFSELVPGALPSSPEELSQTRPLGKAHQDIEIEFPDGRKTGGRITFRSSTCP